MGIHLTQYRHLNWERGLSKEGLAATLLQDVSPIKWDNAASTSRSAVRDGYSLCQRMEDYPRNLAEFVANEQACREYLCQLRWPEGFRCPRCGHDKTWAVRTVLLQCASCGHQASATAGTIFQDTRKAPELVSSHVVAHQPEERGQRTGIATSVGPGQLQDGHLVAQARYGPDATAQRAR